MDERERRVREGLILVIVRRQIQFRAGLIFLVLQVFGMSWREGRVGRTNIWMKRKTGSSGIIICP